MSRETMMREAQPVEPTSVSLIPAALRAVRRARRMQASEVARAMNLPSRTYEHLESGSGRITYDRIVAFAQATNSDALAIFATEVIGDPEFAVRCMGNKLVTAIAIALGELDEQLGDDMDYLAGGTVLGAHLRINKELVAHVRARDTVAERQIEEGLARLSKPDRLKARLTSRSPARLRPRRA